MDNNNNNNNSNNKSLIESQKKDISFLISAITENKILLTFTTEIDIARAQFLSEFRRSEMYIVQTFWVTQDLKPNLLHKRS